MGDRSNQRDAVEAAHKQAPAATRTQALAQAVGSIDLARDFANVPCARKALLSGITGGTSIGAIRFFFSRRPMSAINWTVWSFAGLSVFVWHDCRSKRAAELQRMREVAAQFDRRKRTQS